MIFGGTNAVCGFLYPFFAPKNSVYVLQRFFNSIEKERPEFFELLTRYKYGEKPLSPFENIVAFWDINADRPLSLKLYHAAHNNRMGVEAFEGATIYLAPKSIYVCGGTI